VEDALDVRKHPDKLVHYSDKFKLWNAELRAYLYQNLYYNPEVHGPGIKAVRLLVPLFQYFLKHPEEMRSPQTNIRPGLSDHRAVCDYLAGMTDRSIMKEYHRLFVASEDDENGQATVPAEQGISYQRVD